MVLVLTSRAAARSFAGGGVLSGFGFACCDRASDLTRDLLMRLCQIAAAYVI